MHVRDAEEGSLATCPSHLRLRGPGDCRSADQSQGLWKVAREQTLTTDLLQDVILTARKLAGTRLRAICHVLQDENEELRGIKTFHCTCATLLGAVFDDNLDLLFGQHLSNVVSCCVYASARVHNCVLSFRRINLAAMAVSPHLDASVFKHADLKVKALSRPSFNICSRGIFFHHDSHHDMEYPCLANLTCGLTCTSHL